MKSLTAALARVCKTLKKYEIAHDDKPPVKRAVADVFRVLPSSEELVALYTTTLRSDILFTITPVTSSPLTPSTGAPAVGASTVTPIATPPATPAPVTAGAAPAATGTSHS